MTKNSTIVKFKNCPQCGRFMNRDEANDDNYHWGCLKCDMFYCFEEGCHCCETE